jgi:hypothetical protein
MGHNPEPSFGDPPSRKKDRVSDGSVCPSVALCLGTALETETMQEGFRTCYSLAESRDIVDIRRRSYVMASNNDPELEVRVWLHNKLFGLIRGFKSVNDPVELASRLLSLVIVCDDGSKCRAQVTHDEMVISVIELVLVSQCEMAFTDAYYLWESDVANISINSKYEFQGSS